MPRFEYAPAPESRSVVDIHSSYGLFIGGEFVDSSGNVSFKTISPATDVGGCSWIRPATPSA